MPKTSIRFFDTVPVRSVWDEETAKWWLCAADVISAVVETANPRVYWATVKRRNSELFADCKQLKLTASDGKSYRTDVINDEMLDSLMAVLKSPKKEVFQKWISSIGSTLDEKSKLKAYDLFESGAIKDVEVGTVKGLRQKQKYQQERLCLCQCAVSCRKPETDRKHAGDHAGGDRTEIH